MAKRGPYYGVERKQFAVRLTDEQRSRLYVLSDSDGLYMGEWLANLIDSTWTMRMGNVRATHKDGPTKEIAVAHGKAKQSGV